MRNLIFNFQIENAFYQIHFPTRKDADEENQGIFTALKGDDRHKNKKI